MTAPAKIGARQVNAALWSTYFHRHYVGAGAEKQSNRLLSELPSSVRPVSLNDALEILHRAPEDAITLPGAVSPERQAQARRMLRGVRGRAAAQVLRGGHLLDRDSSGLLGKVARKSVGARDVQTALQQVATQDRALSDTEREVQYFEVLTNGHTTTGRFGIVVHAPLERVAPMCDPRSWAENEAFREIRIVSSDVDPGEPGKTAWSGSYFEHYEMSWNLMAVTAFRATLLSDMTVMPFEVRCDFSLIKEEDDQITTDRGYVRAQRVEGDPSKTRVTIEKKLSFRSPLLNFNSPALMAMFLERSMDAWWGLAATPNADGQNGTSR